MPGQDKKRPEPFFSSLLRRLLVLSLPLVALFGCRGSWVTTSDVKHPVTFHVDSPGAQATVDVNGMTCGNTPTSCRTNVTASEVWHHSRKVWKAYVGYSSLSAGPYVLLAGLPFLTFDDEFGGSHALGLSLIGVGAGLMILGTVLLISYYGGVKKKYAGVHYNPEHIIVRAVQAGRYKQQIKLPTKAFIERYNRRRIRFRFMPETAPWPAPQPLPVPQPSPVVPPKAPADPNRPSI